MKGITEYDYVLIPGAFYALGLDLPHLVALSVINGASQGRMGIYRAGAYYIAQCALVSDDEAVQIIKDLWEAELIERVRDRDGKVGWQVV